MQIEGVQLCNRYRFECRPIRNPWDEIEVMSLSSASTMQHEHDIQIPTNEVGDEIRTACTSCSQAFIIGSLCESNGLQIQIRLAGY